MKGKLILGLLSILSLGAISISTTSCTITYKPDYNSPDTDEDSSTDTDENSSTDSDEDNLIINVEEDTTEYTEGLEFKLSEDETSYIVSDYNGSSTDWDETQMLDQLTGGSFLIWDLQQNSN